MLTTSWRTSTWTHGPPHEDARCRGDRTAAARARRPRPSSRPCAAPSPNTATTARGGRRPLHPVPAEHQAAPVPLPQLRVRRVRPHSHFDPSRPTSLLYKPVTGGFERSAPCTPRPGVSTRISLTSASRCSITAWHQHVNLCLPPPAKYPTSDWTRFGFHGTVATASECQASGGVFRGRLRLDGPRLSVREPTRRRSGRTKPCAAGRRRPGPHLALSLPAW